MSDRRASLSRPRRRFSEGPEAAKRASIDRPRAIRLVDNVKWMPSAQIRERPVDELRFVDRPLEPQ